MLDQIRAPLVVEVEELVDELAEVQQSIKEFRSDRKTEGSSLYSAVDKILESYNIYRSAYHSG